MLKERKRFSYLTVQQRALNSSNAIDSEKAVISSKPGSIISSNTKTHHKQQHHITELSKPFNRNSLVKKKVEPLAELEQNSLLLSIRTSATKITTISDKENNSLGQSLKKDQRSYDTSSQPSRQSQLENKVKQLEEANSMILKQTEEKFLQMEKHLEKVEKILKEKQATIEMLSKEKNQVYERSKSLQNEVERLIDQKEQLLRIVTGKNEEIKRLLTEKQKHEERQADLLEQLNSYALKSKLQSIESIQPTILNLTQKITLQTQTQLQGTEIDQIFAKASQPEDKMNYRQKYEALFKKALEMQDEMYRLKEELFDSQNEVKTIQQEFNTYKIFNQIQKINQKA